MTNPLKGGGNRQVGRCVHSDSGLGARLYPARTGAYPDTTVGRGLGSPDGQTFRPGTNAYRDADSAPHGDTSSDAAPHGDTDSDAGPDSHPDAGTNADSHPNAFPNRYPTPHTHSNCHGDAGSYGNSRPIRPDTGQPALGQRHAQRR